MRSCLPCTACCTTMAVKALDKPRGVRCKHLTDQGCGIYETRPDECRKFYCLWADPNAEALDIPDWGRPDRTGVVLAAMGHDLNERPIIVAHEVTPGAAAGYWAQKLAKRRRLGMFTVALNRAP